MWYIFKCHSQYKLWLGIIKTDKSNEINVYDNWNQNEMEAEKMGGFNFDSEDKILSILQTIKSVAIPNKK